MISVVVFGRHRVVNIASLGHTFVSITKPNISQKEFGADLWSEQIA